MASETLYEDGVVAIENFYGEKQYPYRISQFNTEHHWDGDYELSEKQLKSLIKGCKKIEHKFFEKKNYVFLIKSASVRDEDYVTANDPNEAIEKYINYWKTEQKVNIKPSDIVSITRLGESIE